MPIVHSILNLQLVAEFELFGLGVDGWTAVGAIAAVIAILPLVWGWLKKTCSPTSSADLDMIYARVEEHSSEVNGYYWLRAPIQNLRPTEVKNVEVLINGFGKAEADRVEPIPGFVPMRFRWCNTDLPSCSSIPGDSFKLLHLGMLETRAIYEQKQETLVISGGVSFHLGGEVQTPAHSQLGLGVFRIDATIIADGVKVKPLKFEVSIRKPSEKLGPLVKVFGVKTKHQRG